MPEALVCHAKVYECMTLQRVQDLRIKPVLPHRLECYNARDLDRFLTLLADDVHVSDGETGAIIATSKEQLRPRSGARLRQQVYYLLPLNTRPLE